MRDQPPAVTAAGAIDRSHEVTPLPDEAVTAAAEEANLPVWRARLALEAAAPAIAAAEREACARLAEEAGARYATTEMPDETVSHSRTVLKPFADLIRARS